MIYTKLKQPVVDSATLIGEWLLNGNTNDSSGNGRNGSITGSAVLTANNLTVANNSNDGMNVADADAFSFTNGTTDQAFSFAFRFYMNSAPGTGYFYMLAKKTSSDASQYEWAFTFEDSTKTLLFVIADSVNGGRKVISFPFNPTYLAAYHIALKFDGNINNTKLYLNNQSLTGTVTLIGSYTCMRNTTASLTMAHFGWTLGGQPSGWIDTVRLYSGILSASQISNLYNETDIRSGLIAEYMFSNNANDTSTNTNNGTIISGATLTTNRTGTSNKAISIPNSGAVTATRVGTNYNSISLSFWIYKSQTATERAIHISGQDGVNKDIVITFVPFSAGGGTFFGSKRTTSTIDGVQTKVDLALNTWHHVVAIDDNGTFYMYVNGTLQTLYAYTGMSNVATSITTIGRRGDGGQQFSGKLDDIKIYNRALTVAEVSLLYSDVQF